MTDIIEQLRAYEPDSEYWATAVKDAADEIERLRHLLADMRTAVISADARARVAERKAGIPSPLSTMRLTLP